MTDRCTQKYRAVALGNFDGLHLGHMAVLEAGKSIANDGLGACVVVFDEHSLKVLSGTAPKKLITNDERDELLNEKGFELFTLSFNKIKNYSPQEFVDKILIDKLNAKAVVCGFNYRFGYGAEGNSKTLSKLCKEREIDCIIVDEIDVDGEAVSSTAIRSYIESGEIGKANLMLGRSFGFTTEVISGDKRGRKFGFPTINQIIPGDLVQPKFGVYASKVTVDGTEYKGVTNIGRRPTVGTDTVLSETHILDFNGDVYSKRVSVKLLNYVREERKFGSFDELFGQIRSDVSNVRMG